MRARIHKPAILGGTPRFAEPVFVSRPRVPDQDEFSRLIARVFESKRLTNNGELVQLLEEQLRSRLDTAFCASVCNGTVGLLIALRSLDLRGEIITTPFTFPATVHAIESCGLTPVFCDIDPDTYNISAEGAEPLITDRTSGVLPVHVFGNPSDVVGFERLGKERNLRIVYDAAHAFGVTHRGRGIGSWGDLSVFSFHATKVFHTAEGGAVTGADSAVLERIKSHRNFGIVNEDEVRGVGINGKMSELHAALGLGVLRGFDEEVLARAERVARYVHGLDGVEGIKMQRLAPQTVPNNSHFPIEIDGDVFGLSRDGVHAAMRAEGVFARKYFHPLCSENSAYRSLPSANPDRLRNAHRVADRILCLPLYGELSPESVDGIVECIHSIREYSSTIGAREIAEAS